MSFFCNIFLHWKLNAPIILVLTHKNPSMLSSMQITFDQIAER